MNEKIFVSSCLMGVNCRWHGKKIYKSTMVKRLEKDNPDKEVIHGCPEMLGGLECPRKPVKRRGGKVFITCEDKKNRKNITGKELTKEFKKGAEEVLKICLKNKIKKAVLCKWSPSCDERGITGKLLIKNRIEVFNTF